MSINWGMNFRRSFWCVVTIDDSQLVTLKLDTGNFLRFQRKLSRKACLGIKSIKYLDNNQLNHSQTSDGDVYAHDAPTKPVLSAAEPALSADQLVKKFPPVFGDGVGKLPGEYYVELDEKVNPVQHSPCRVPFGIRELL